MKFQNITINGINYKLIPDSTEYNNLIDNLFGYIEDENLEKSLEFLSKLENEWGNHLSSYQEAKELIKITFGDIIF